jgi:tetratricopeptide (TPR) repeat protein
MRSLASFTLLFFLSANVWAANPPSEEVKAQVRKATGEYNLGQYLEAAKDYEAAYLQTLDVNLLFNVAQSYRLAGETDKAITTYRSYLRSNPHGDQRVLAEAKLRDLEQKRASAPSAPPPATPAGAEPVVTPPLPPPASASSPPQAPPMESAAEAITPSDQSNVLIAAPPAKAPTSSPFYTRWPFWTVTGVVIVGAVVAGVLLSRGGNSLTMPSSTLGTKDF